MGLVLLLLVLRPGPSPEVLRAAQAALAQILGADVKVIVEEAPTTLDDAGAKARQEAQHAAMAALVEQREDEEVALSLRRAGDRPLRHTLAFDREDAATERGRTLGYAIASMLPPAWLASPRGATDPIALHARFSVALAPELALGLGSSSAPYGARASFGWRFADRWVLELGGAWRTGALPTVQATFSHASANLGVGVFLRLPPRGSGLTVLAHARAGVVRHQADHLDEDDVNEVQRATWLAGGSVGLEGVWWFSAAAGVSLAADLEVDAGAVDVYLLGKRKTTLGPASALMALGVRIRF